MTQCGELSKMLGAGQKVGSRTKCQKNVGVQTKDGDLDKMWGVGKISGVVENYVHGIQIEF